MSYTCRACGEQATLTACEHCGGQGRSQSAIAEVARLRAELDAVTRERDTAKAGTWSRVEREVHLRRERDEAIAILAARDTAIAELRAALESARLAIRQGAAQEARNITEDALTNKEDAA